MSFCPHCRSGHDPVSKDTTWACGVRFNDSEWRTKECYRRNLNAANAHIKRLEEVGDEMLNWLTDDGISMENLRLIANAWRKAKRVGTIRQTTGAKDRGSW